MLSAGIGAGLVLDGALVRGHARARGRARPLVVEPDGVVCRCGNRGCLETVASAPALLRRCVRCTATASRSSRRWSSPRAGDEGTRRLFADGGRRVGRAVGAVCNIVNPELVIVGGDMSVVGDVLVDAVRAGIAQATIPAIRDDARVVPGMLGDRAEVLGAVGLVLSETESNTIAALNGDG